MAHEIPSSIINPEIPETKEAKLELLRKCLAVLSAGGEVTGVLPHHVSQDGVVLIARRRYAVSSGRHEAEL